MQYFPAKNSVSPPANVEKRWYDDKKERLWKLPSIMLMLRKPHISAEQLRAIEPPTLVPAGSKDLVAELILEFCPGEA